MIDTSLYCPSVSLDEGEDKSHTKILEIKRGKASKERCRVGKGGGEGEVIME